MTTPGRDPNLLDGKAPEDEDSLDGATLVVDLGPNDVIMGRGAMQTEYEGNKRLRDLLVEHREGYASSNKHKDKQQIVWAILATVQALGGRFLRRVEPPSDPQSTDPNEFLWCVVDDRKVLTDKVKQMMRDVMPQTRLKRKLRKRKQKPDDEEPRVENLELHRKVAVANIRVAQGESRTEHRNALLQKTQFGEEKPKPKHDATTGSSKPEHTTAKGPKHQITAKSATTRVPNESRPPAAQAGIASDTTNAALPIAPPPPQANVSREASIAEISTSAIVQRLEDEWNRRREAADVLMSLVRPDPQSNVNNRERLPSLPIENSTIASSHPLLHRITLAQGYSRLQQPTIDNMALELALAQLARLPQPSQPFSPQQGYPQQEHYYPNPRYPGTTRGKPW